MRSESRSFQRIIERSFGAVAASVGSLALLECRF
jgi:hypothetical protein